MDDMGTPSRSHPAWNGLKGVEGKLVKLSDLKKKSSESSHSEGKQWKPTRKDDK